MVNVNKERLQRAIDAEAKALKAQRYKIGRRENERADLDKISGLVDGLLSAGAGATSRPGVRSRQVILRDT